MARQAGSDLGGRTIPSACSEQLSNGRFVQDQLGPCDFLKNSGNSGAQLPQLRAADFCLGL